MRDHIKCRVKGVDIINSWDEIFGEDGILFTTPEGTEQDCGHCINEDLFAQKY